MNEDILNPLSLVIPMDTEANIVTISATAEMGALFFDSDNSKLIFVKNAGGHEHVQ